MSWEYADRNIQRRRVAKRGKDGGTCCLETIERGVPCYGRWLETGERGDLGNVEVGEVEWVKGYDGGRVEGLGGGGDGRKGGRG